MEKTYKYTQSVYKVGSPLKRLKGQFLRIKSDSDPEFKLKTLRVRETRPYTNIYVRPRHLLRVSKKSSPL